MRYLYSFAIALLLAFALAGQTSKTGRLDQPANFYSATDAFYIGPGGSGSRPTAGGATSALTFGESSGTTPTCQAGLDIIWSSYSASGLQICNNGGSLAPIAALPISLTTQVSGKLQTANGAALVGTTGSLGGSALTAGNCSTTTVAITGALNTMAVSVTPAASPGNNYYWKGVVTSSGTVTVYVCAVTSGTPTSETYNVRVIQ